MYITVLVKYIKPIGRLPYYYSNVVLRFHLEKTRDNE